MEKTAKEKFQRSKNNLFFGSTAAVITNLGLLIGLYSLPNPRLTIISGILVIGIADNISDTLGIHVYQEAEGMKAKKVWFYTLGNYCARLAISLLFALFVAILPLKLAVACSLTVGLIFIILISYSIAKHNKTNPAAAIAEHLGVALLVIIISRVLGSLITEL